MPKRLLWNFEVDESTPICFNRLNAPKEELRWEARFFWTGNAPICLKAYDEALFHLADWQFKTQEDSYLLHPKAAYNLKKRRELFVYKPLVAEKNGLRAYGKKINLAEQAEDTLLPNSALTSRELLGQLASQSQEFRLNKDVAQFNLILEPKIKLELVRFSWQSQLYFSLCIQGRSFSLVDQISQSLVGVAERSAYVDFLKDRKNHHE